MSAVLNDVIKAVKAIEIERPKGKKKVADELLGKYKGVIPQGETSTEFIRKLRDSRYGKAS